MVGKFSKDVWKKIFAIMILLLFLGVIIAIALVNINFSDILMKVP